MNVEFRICAARAILGIMASALLLSGCAMSMLSGASRAGGQPVSASGSGTASPAGGTTSQVMADSSISTSVRSRLGANAALKPLKIAVDTHDGVVTLRGQVNNVEQRNAAQLEARAVSGVKAVKNELTVR